jgi:hypothetical protein
LPFFAEDGAVFAGATGFIAGDDAGTGEGAAVGTIADPPAAGVFSSGVGSDARTWPLT